MRRGIIVLFVLSLGLIKAWGQDFGISGLDVDERAPATAYNILEDEFLVVWVSAEHKIHGRLVTGDGTLLQGPFVVFDGGTSNLMPDVAYNRLNNEYLVVWEDWRREMGVHGPDIFGIRLNPDGHKIWSPRSEPDTSFAVCDNDSSQYHPKIAHNYKDNNYLVVWHDGRHNYRYGDSQDQAIYGQRLFWNANLLPPLDTPDSKVNFMIGEDMDYRDINPDVAYHGGMGGTLNEFFVVFMRMYSPDMSSPSRIWGARVKGNNGLLLNSWGIEQQPGNAQKSAGGPPWGREMVVSWDGETFWGTGGDYIDGSPHVISNDDGAGASVGRRLAYERYPVPEFLVSWTSFKLGWDNPDIRVQRVGYFPDSTAYRLGMKMQFNGTNELGPDSNWVAVPLDSAGNWADPPWAWLLWNHSAACSNTAYQTANELTYNPLAEEYLVIWLDWRTLGHSGWPTNPGDVYGQHLYIDPADSAMQWTDAQGNPGHDPTLNTPIATAQPDEGNGDYPCVAHGIDQNRFLVGYEYDVDGDDNGIGIHGIMHAGAIPTAVDDPLQARPDDFLLVSNYPNPFNPETAIQCRIPVRGRARLTVYDLRGRLVETLLDAPVDAGVQTLRWRPQGPSGVYFCRLESGGRVAVRKMVYLR